MSPRGAQRRAARDPQNGPVMKIHEYQAKRLLATYGVAVPRGEVATTIEDATKAAAALGGGICVVKAQIHAGGRGKGGGVKVCKTADDVKKAAEGILNKPLITPQTGPKGTLVKTLWIEEGSDIAQELYIGLTIDRAKSKICVMASSEGGMDIEEVAEKHPEKILREWIRPGFGLQPYQARNLAFGIGVPKASVNKAVKFLMALSKAFHETDASLAEINPLVVTKSGEIIALDAKMTFDDDALDRHPKISELRDINEEDEAERIAKEFGLAYIALDGDIGCLVNGAGLAMGTLDIITHYGGMPANFLDVGGGATTEKVTQAFKIILRDPKVKAILVNIFGGIMKCDVIANGVVAAAKEVGIKVPLVVRLEGTNVEQGRQILAESGLKITSAKGMADAAETVVKAAKGK
jgi:succinyl-CoA synthetase beta subunit